MAIKFLYLLAMFSFGQNSCNNKTSNDYKNKTTVSTEVYNKDEKVLADKIQQLIDNKEDPYYYLKDSEKYNIFIDTILYSPDKYKLAFFVILKKTDQDNVISFDANCFIGNIDSNSVVYNIRWLSANNLTNYTNYKETSEDIRALHFNKPQREGFGTVDFNLDDTRFWTCHYWNKK